MESSLVIAAMSMPSLVLRYAAAFFFVVVAIGLAYACYKAGKTLERVDKVLDDVDQEAVPLMRKAAITLDEVNANLDNVDGITQDVASITDKIDKLANSVESAVSAPARKAAAFTAGVQSAVSSFMRRARARGASPSSDAATSSDVGDEATPKPESAVTTNDEPATDTATAAEGDAVAPGSSRVEEPEADSHVSSGA